MESKENCKGCSRSVRIPSEDIKNMVEEIRSCSEFKLVSEGIYNNRLEQCEECRHLEYETTCNQCGCFVQVRALLMDKDCPHPKKSKWHF